VGQVLPHEFFGKSPAWTYPRDDLFDVLDSVIAGGMEFVDDRLVDDSRAGRPDGEHHR
jgi:hypothetical protein